MQRRAEFRPFSWLNDLFVRDQVDLSPPYQRRSVWSDRYRTDFITTVLLNYPCPAIFLYEEIKADGSFIYKVVDGKQRLTTMFSFVKDEIPVADDYPIQQWRGSVFSNLPDDAKLRVWRYSFAVEFIEQESEPIINDIFNRINKNVARLTPQELRHAKFSGYFLQSVEDLANFAEEMLGPNFPNIAVQSRRQMKDVENIATLMLFLEVGERSFSQADLDRAFRDREEIWDRRGESEREFRTIIEFVSQVLAQDRNNIIKPSRLKNQADFYSLFAALAELGRDGRLPTAHFAVAQLSEWIGQLFQLTQRNEEEGAVQPQIEAAREREAAAYLDAARAASNDAGPRRRRIDIMKAVLTEV